MLKPQDRRHLLATLSPPPGYELDHVIGTTFSLNLLALVNVPRGFTQFEREDEEGRPSGDPLPLLAALRRHADRLSVFYQAGRISVPRFVRPLLGHLEGSIFQVRVPEKGLAFHPKIWLQRFTSEEGPTIYRLLVLTRNVTFGPRWDTMLALEGAYAQGEVAHGPAGPLADFVAELPRISLAPPPRGVEEKIELVQRELRGTAFAPPEGFRAVRFWPVGLGGARQWPFGRKGADFDRILILSPFLSGECLARFRCDGSDDVLISRPESLSRVEESVLSDFGRVFVLNPSASVLEDANEHSPLGENAVSHNLHAKLYIAERGDEARVWTGSANANRDAYGGNYEFLVEMVGDKSEVGIDAFMEGRDGRAGFAEVLQDYDGRKDYDAEEARLESIVEAGRQSVSGHNFTARVTRDPEGFARRLSLSLAPGDSVELPPGVAATCRPITLPDSDYQRVTEFAGTFAEFGPLPPESITSFFAFELAVEEGGRQFKIRFVINARLEGAPADRRARILLSVLSNREDALRFLLMLLAEGDARIARLLFNDADGAPRDVLRRAGSAPPPLSEALTRVLERRPEKLDHVAAALEDLKMTPEGSRLLPDGFEELWRPVWEERERLRAPGAAG